MINLTLKDGSVRTYDQPVSAYDLAKDLSEGLARRVYAASIDGELADLRTVLDRDAEVEFLTFDDEGGQHAFHHTSSHILAQAVLNLFPDTALAIGPAIDNGFYYDFDREVPFSEDDLEQIEAEMAKIIKADLPITRFTLPRDEAIALCEEHQQPYKVELIRDLPDDEPISFYQQGDFIDLCAGPHLLSTKHGKAFKLLSVAGAYWRGSEKNKMLTRIYGTSFPKKSDLNDYLERLEEAKRRDHRKIGKEMRLFMFHDAGPGFPFFLPNGMTLKNTLLDYWREVHEREGYREISTPLMLKSELWKMSGHWDHYKDNMYATVIDEEDFAIKPMNCPGGLLAYMSEPRSYRDLPLRFGELGVVHRHEKSGTLHGLMRVRCFTQDDAHLYMTPEQMHDEIKGVVRLIDEVYKVFGFSYRVELSTRPDNSMGTDEEWDRATEALRLALEDMQVKYVINEGDGAFYGPKIDFHLEDSIGRTWQCGTCQLDFQMPQRFGAEYIGSDGAKHRPIMIHRTAFGSIERFIAVITEHYAGKFPLWLAPVQVKILPISSEKHAAYAADVCASLRAAGIRVEIDARNEKIGYKIREAQLEKVPYMLILGDKEQADQTVAVRKRDNPKNEIFDVQTFVEHVKELNEKRALTD